MSGIVRVAVDPDLCESNARCMATAPEVFHLGVDDVARVLMEHPPEELWGPVELAARRCPKGAIRVDRE
jgi:ferredoxin